MRCSAVIRSVPSAGTCGLSSSTIRSPPIPAVRLISTLRPLFLTRSTTSLNNAISRLPFPVCGSRTCRCTIAAPASAASIAEVAICSGVTGIAGCLSTVSPAPVTAQVTTTLLFIAIFSTPSYHLCIVSVLCQLEVYPASLNPSLASHPRWAGTNARAGLFESRPGNGLGGAPYQRNRASRIPPRTLLRSAA